MACSDPLSMGHPHCTLCGRCLICEPHDPHTKQDDRASR